MGDEMDKEVSRKKHVLFVDDEPQISKIFGLKLKMAGYDVTATASGAAAVELVRTRGFDIMLLDVLLPDLSGLEVLEMVRRFSGIPIILFSARNDISRIAELREADYIAKPLNPDALVRKIEAALSGQSAPSTPSLTPRP